MGRYAEICGDVRRYGPFGRAAPPGQPTRRHPPSLRPSPAPPSPPGEHMPDKERYVQEMSRVLKPGGRIVIATWCEREATHPRCGGEGRAASAGGLDASWLTCESRRRRPSAPRSARPSTTCTASGRTRTSSRLRSTAASWRGPARLDEMLREDPRGPGRVRPQHGEDRRPAAPALAPARLGRVATTRPRRLPS